MKKQLLLSLIIIIAFSMTACNSRNDAVPVGTDDASAYENGDPESEGSTDVLLPRIGISMPTVELERWNRDGIYMKTMFEEAGYEVDLRYAGDNDIAIQGQQIEEMITDNVDVLIIAAIDGDSLHTALQGAGTKGIPVIAYDRLLMNTDAVSYFVTFDLSSVGIIQGRYIEETLGLKTNTGPFNIELFAGDPGDGNFMFPYIGCMSVLQPYIDSGQLVVPSGEIERMAVAIVNLSTENSQARMENLIAAQGYGPEGKRLDAVWAVHDSLANGITNALVSADYTKENFPLLTGQDCDVTSVKNMIEGLQSMSVYRDTRILADQTVKMVNSILRGEEPELNNFSTYNNNVKVVPAYLCDAVAVTADNYREYLPDTEYYKEVIAE